jgi:hypothetical protein
MKHFGIEKIISGGQTGADRGGLDAALALKIPHGGYCPKNRKAEDGRIPNLYDLQETDTDDYRIRTHRNVAFAHATIVFAYGPLDGGSLLTLKFCHELRTQCHVVDLLAKRPTGLKSFLKTTKPKCLNIAGNRESKSPGIQRRVKEVLVEVLL